MIDDSQTQSVPQENPAQPTNIPLASVDHYALEIVQRLQKKGFETYLVGGCVRDLLVGVQPKDFDIATNAHPHEVKKSIPYCFIIGRRFKLVLAKRGERTFEVATFRRQMNDEELVEAQNAVDLGDSALIGDNVFGTSEEDAKRRDFTINGLLFDPVRNRLRDYVEGMHDIKLRMIRMIGDPETRLKEDPIRILRALRLAHKLNFRIEPSLGQQMKSCAGELKKSVLPRKREEYLKILRLDDPALAFIEMFDLQILHNTLPSFVPLFEDQEKLFTFTSILTAAQKVGFDLQSPMENLSVLLYAFFRAQYPEVPLSELGNMVREDQHLSMMKDELGIFKSEALHFLSCIDSYLIFEDVEKYKRKGERRKESFLTQEQLPLAFRLFFIDQTLTSEKNLFWYQELKSKNLLS